MQRILTWFLVASVTAFLVSGEAWPQERFKISISPLVQEAFPNIKKTLRWFAEERNSPFDFVESKKLPKDVADGNTEPYEIVLGFKSELSSEDEAKVSMELARMIMWNMVVLTREKHKGYAVVNIKKPDMIAHSENPFVRTFTNYVFGDCMGKAKQSKFEPLFVWDKSKLEQAKNYIFFVFDGHKNDIGYDQIREFLEFGEIRLARWFGPDDFQAQVRRLKNCLKKIDRNVISHEFFVGNKERDEKSTTERDKKSATEVVYPTETILNQNWYTREWHALQRVDRLAFFMRKDRDRHQNFVDKFFMPFLYPTIQKLARDFRRESWMRKTVLDVFDGSRLMTTGKLATIIRANIEFYEDAKDRYDNRILYIYNSGKLIHVGGKVREKNLLDRAVIEEAKELIRSSGKYFAALANDRVQTLTRETFDFRRMTVFAHELLSQHYYNLSLLKNKNANKEATLKAQELAQIHLYGTRDAADAFIQEHKRVIREHKRARNPARGSVASIGERDWFLEYDDPKKSNSVMKRFKTFIGRANRSEGGDS